jgi:DNA-binding SARP family transcriptional activator/tetratricopeptide (TPR) repeat protein
VLFRLLGPVEIESAAGTHSLARRQERCLLALLLLEPGQVVPVDRLCQLLWEDSAPDQPRRAVQSLVARVRAALVRAAAESSGVSLESVGGGYRIRVDRDLVDAHRFRRLVGEAAGVSDLARREELLADALVLWRGPALADAVSERLREQLCAELDELRMHAVEESISTRLALGRHAELVPELARLTATHPLRERLAELHMTALYRAGRTAEALSAYAHVRELLAEQLGIDPGPGLGRLHRAILRGEELGALRRETPVQTSIPRCLPRDIGDFTGRDEILRHLRAVVPDRSDARSAVLTVDGMAGVGKTALAVHLAHEVADRYPDGQLAIDLHGHSERSPVEVTAALDTLLRQLGIAGDRIPDGLEARVALWRTELSGRRILLLLDNAATSDQVSPLLPTGIGCLTLITSRRRLSGLDDVRSFSLDILKPAEAIALLDRIVGDRVAADPVAAAEVASRCGYLTLAIRLAAARLAHRPAWTAADLASRLKESRPTLPEIAAEGRTVLASLGLSYNHVSPEAQRMFRLLGLPRGPDIDTRAAACLGDVELDTAGALLDELVDAHLLEEPQAGRYRLHDLLKEYAKNLVELRGTDNERRAAIGRLFDYYVHSAVAASGPLEIHRSRFDYQLGDPPRPVTRQYDRPSAIYWFGVERPNLVSVVEHAVEGGWHVHAWMLTRALWRFFYDFGYHDDCITTHELALRSAHAADDEATAAILHNYLAGTYDRQGRWQESYRHLAQAISIRKQIGDRTGQAGSMTNRGRVLLRCGRYAEALRSFEDALAVRLDAKSDQIRVGDTLGNIGLTHMMLGNRARAENYFQQHLTIALASGVPEELGTAYAHLGELELLKGRYSVALDLLQRAVELRNDEPVIRADVIRNVGNVYRGLGELGKAEHHQLEALRTMEDCGDLYGECDVRIELGVTLHLKGETNQALDQLRQALDIADRLQVAPQEARALDELAKVLAATDPSQASELRSRADAIYQELDLPRPANPVTLEA